MPTPRQQYAKALNDIARRYSGMEDTTIRALIQALQDLRVRLSAEILSGGSDFQVYRLREIQRNIALVIDQFQGTLDAELRRQLTGAYGLGAASVVDPLTAAGIAGAFTVTNPAILNASLDYSAALIRNIADTMRGQIDVQIRLAALGARSPFETMQAVTDILGVNARDGVWGIRRRPEIVKGVAARAEAITRTELTRLYNVAGHSQQLETAKQVPELLKAWVATPDKRTRRRHLDAHMRYTLQPIPVGQPFLVNGYPLMYPGDPMGPAGETVNCRCTARTIHPALGVVGTPLDARISAELAKRKAKK